MSDLNPVIVEVEDPRDKEKWVRIDYWTEYRVSQHLLNACGNFNISPSPDAAEYFLPGNQRIRILVRNADGEHLQFTGVTDEKASHVGSDGRSLNITGRDMAAVIVDSDAPYMSLVGLTVTGLAEKLCEPWMPDYITVLLYDNEPNCYRMVGRKGTTATKLRKSGDKYYLETVKTGAIKGGKSSPYFRGIDDSFRDTTINKPESIWAILERQLKNCGCTLWMTADAALFMGRPNYQMHIHQPGLVLKKDGTGNVLAADLTISTAERYSDYTVRAQGRNKKTDRGSTTTKHTASIRDPGSAFYKLKTDGTLERIFYKTKNISLGKHVRDNKILRRHARCVVEKSLVSSYKYQIAVADHQSGNGLLWTTDCVVDVLDEVNNVSGPHYIIGRDFVRGITEGARTVLHLVPAELWLYLDPDKTTDEEWDTWFTQKVWW